MRRKRLCLCQQQQLKLECLNQPQCSAFTQWSWNHPRHTAAFGKENDKLPCSYLAGFNLATKCVEGTMPNQTSWLITSRIRTVWEKWELYPKRKEFSTQMFRHEGSSTTCACIVFTKSHGMLSIRKGCNYFPPGLKPVFAPTHPHTLTPLPHDWRMLCCNITCQVHSHETWITM